MENIIAVSAVRKVFASICKSANQRLQRYILTGNDGAEAVLLGIGDYRSLVSAAELLSRPDVIRQSRRGMKQLKKGKGITLSQMKKRLKKRKLLQPAA